MTSRTSTPYALDARRSPFELMWDPQEIRALRRALGLTQDEFARRLCTTQQTVSEWEIGKHRPRCVSRSIFRLLASEVGFESMPAATLRLMERRAQRTE